MIDRLKQLVRHSAVYSINSITEKAVGIILIPLFTYNFTTGDFGNWDLLDTSINIMADVLLFGLATVVVFFNNPKEYTYEKKSSFFTLTLFLFFLSVLFTAAVEFFISFKLFPINIRPEILNIIRIASYIIAIRAVNSFLLGKLRADERSIHYTIIYSVKLFLRTALIVYFIQFTEEKWNGIFYSSLIAEIVTLALLSPVLAKNISFKLNWPALGMSVKIGGALVLSTIGFNLLNLSDRYIIKYLIGEDNVGLYGLGYRVAGILNMFLILPYTLTLIPSTYKIYKQKDDKRYFSKLMTYSSFFFIWGAVVLSLFSREIVKMFGQNKSSGDAYLTAFTVVPVILFGYVFSGMRLTASLGMMLTKNTKHIGSTTLIAAAANIILNFILIPVYGIMGAAFNTLLAYIIFYFLTLGMSNKYYQVPFEQGKLFIMLIVGMALSSVIYFLPEMNLIPLLALKILLIIAFPFILYIFNFYEKAELEVLLSKDRLVDFAKGIFKKNNDSDKMDDSIVK
jgi:O-antigen/teichoic acid export membrane protein